MYQDWKVKLVLVVWALPFVALVCMSALFEACDALATWRQLRAEQRTRALGGG